MRRRLCIYASAISLLLCVATTVIWLRSYWVGDGWQFARLTRPGEGWYSAPLIRFGSGCCIINWDHGMWVQGQAVPLWSYRPDEVPARFPDTTSLFSQLWEYNWWERRGFYIGVGPTHYGQTGLQAIIFPLWLPTALFMVIPTILIIKRRRHGTAGSCPNCRYNLNGNMSGVCPECGTAILDMGATA